MANPQVAGADPVDRRAAVQQSARRAQRAVATILLLALLLGLATIAASYRVHRSQVRAENAEADARDRSWHASLAQARAERLSTEAGHRARALAAISNAAAIRPSVELRDEAIAALALRDLETEVSWDLRPGALGFYFDPEMRHYVVGYSRGDVSMFRLADNVPVRTFRAADAGLGTNASSFGAIFSATGRYVVVPYQSGEILLWERDTGRLARAFGRRDHPESLGWRPTFTSDDRILCARSAAHPDSVVFVDLESGQRRELTVPGVNDTVRMNNQGRLLAWTDRTNLFLNDAHDGSLRRAVSWPANVLSFRWDAQGRQLSVWCGDGTLNLLALDSGRIRQLGGRLVGPWVQHFSPDGTMLASSGLDGTSRIWNVEEARLLAQTTDARAFVWAEDGQRLAFAIPGRRVGVWRLTQPSGYRNRPIRSDPLSDIWYQDMSPDGRWMVTTPTKPTTSPAIELSPLATDAPSLLVPTRGRSWAGFHPTEPRLFVADAGEWLSYRLPGSLTEMPTDLGPAEKISLPENFAPAMFSFSANGRWAAVVDARQRLAVVEWGTSNRMTFMEGTAPVLGQAGPGSVTGSGALVLSPDGRWIAMGRNNAGRAATVWDAATGKVVHQFGSEASHLTFSPDGRRLLQVGPRAWGVVETGSWKALWTHSRAPLVEKVGAAAYSADGSMLACTHAVDTIEIVEPETGEHLATVSGPSSIEISGLRFSTNGLTLAAAGQGEIHVWDLRALRGDLAKLGLDWPLGPRPSATTPWRQHAPLLMGAAGLGVLMLAGVLGLVSLRRHSRLTREFVQTTETATRLHESERAAHLALEQEKDLSRLKSQFVTTVSHEFRTPLGVIMSSAENLKDYHDRLKPVQRDEHLQDIINATRTMSGLMEEVLLLGRVESGKVSFRPAPLDLRPFCQRVIEEVLTATDHRCPIELHLAASERPARGDEGLLRHILTNLLNNAVKYSPVGRPVELRIVQDEAFAVLIIRDGGIGIPPEDLPHLFDPFHRGRNVGDIPGSGLGMVIVKRCVGMHGGTIDCQSAINEGTTFTARLPLFTRL